MLHDSSLSCITSVVHSEQGTMTRYRTGPIPRSPPCYSQPDIQTLPFAAAGTPWLAHLLSRFLVSCLLGSALLCGRSRVRGSKRVAVHRMLDPDCQSRPAFPSSRI